MAKIKTASEIAEKWGRVTPGRSADYADGVANPKADWKTQTLAATSAYNQGIQASISNKSFEKGVSAAGTAKWQEKATTIGTARFSSGVSAAQGDYESGFAPYRDVIANTTLPARKATGDPSNIERVTKLATALHAKKISG